MSQRLTTCSMCGTCFDPEGHQACRTCPLQPGCQLACCPVCGYETVDESKSILARWAAKLLRISGKNDEDYSVKLRME